MGLPAIAAAETEASCGSLPPRLATAPKGGRIDLHAHHIPPVYRAALLEAGMATIGGYPTPQWSPERHLAMMDSYGIQMAVLSLSDPGVSFLKGDAAKTLARQVNEYTAGLVKDQPTRFGGFAVLPLPDLAASLDELAYALDVLKLDGVALLTSYDGVNIAMPQYAPLWAELNRRKAFVFMHPAALTADDKPNLPLPDFFVEFTFETTRFCALALNTGLTTVNPDVRIQLAHAGGAFPFLDYRVGVIQNGAGNQLPIKGADQLNGVLPAAQINPLYYDTALNPAPAAMRSILEISDVNHIVFGSDWPFTELLFVIPGDPQPPLSRTFNEQQRHAIERANALRQLPGVAARLGAAAETPGAEPRLVRARAVRTRTRRRQLRFLLETSQPVQVEATVTRGGKELTAKRFVPIAKGRRTLRLSLPDDLPRGRVQLALRVTDGFGNTTVLRSGVTLPQ